MSEGLVFLWIDDESSMKTAAENLEENTRAKVYFYDLTNDDLAKIESLVEKHAPNLVIVDHKLNKTTGFCGLRKTTGATVSEVIKESNPQLPVVCITKVDLNRDITFAQRSAYDAVIDAAHLTDERQILVALAKGFRGINNEPPKNEEDLLQLLGCPDVDQIRLMQVLPSNLKTGFGQKGFASMLWRWIDEVLFARPGFLYDSLWSATLVGAKESSFIKVQEKLQAARYSGIFANDVCPRWWASKIQEILYKNSPTSEQDDPRLLGRAYLQIPEEEFSKCEISGKDPAETVAYTDTTNLNRKQVCLQLTDEHPGFQALLFFETIRIINEGEE